MLNSLKSRLRKSGNQSNENNVPVQKPSAQPSLPYSVPISVNEGNHHIPHHPAGNGMDFGIPVVDERLPQGKKEHRRASVVAASTQNQILRTFTEAAKLPSLHEVDSSEIESLLRKKLEACVVVDFDWSSSSADFQAKTIKMAILQEVLEHQVSQNRFLPESVYGDIINMTTANIFRPILPTSTSFINHDEIGGIQGEGDFDESVDEPAWMHLQLVYEIFLQFIVASDVKVKYTKNYINNTFCSKLLELFVTEDPREREYLKTILHRIYGKFMAMRSFIRSTISQIFYNFVFETDNSTGIAEILEILGSIISGFTLPLKDEHRLFLERSLIPLHRPRSYARYSQQLKCCMLQFIEKEPPMVTVILNGIMKHWPRTSSSKQIQLLGEVEELLEFSNPDELVPLVPALCSLLAECLRSPHYHVAERALFFFSNDTLVLTGLLSERFRHIMLPEVLPIVEEMVESYRDINPAVSTLATNVIEHYKSQDRVSFAQFREAGTQRLLEKGQLRAYLEKEWKLLQESAQAVLQQRQRQAHVRSRPSSVVASSQSADFAHLSTSSSGALFPRFQDFGDSRLDVHAFGGLNKRFSLPGVDLPHGFADSSLIGRHDSGMVANPLSSFSSTQRQISDSQPQVSPGQSPRAAGAIRMDLDLPFPPLVQSHQLDVPGKISSGNGSRVVTRTSEGSMGSIRTEGKEADLEEEEESRFIERLNSSGSAGSSASVQGFPPNIAPLNSPFHSPSLSSTSSTGSYNGSYSSRLDRSEKESEEESKFTD